MCTAKQKKVLALLMHPGMSTYNMNIIASLFKVRKDKGGYMLGFNLVNFVHLWGTFKINPL